MFKLQPIEMKQHENKLSTRWRSCFKYDKKNSFVNEYEASPRKILCGLIQFQIHSRLEYYVKSENGHERVQLFFQMMSIKLSKVFQSNRLNYKVTLISNRLNLKKTYFILDDYYRNANWQIYHEDRDYNRNKIEYDLTLSLEITSCTYTGFNLLLEDTNLTDIELRGVDGSVRVHKAILEGHSPVMMAMFSGDWKEAATGVVQVTNTTKETLQQLKDFLYVRKLPESGMTNLAALASTYMISELEECCTVKLLTTISANNASELLNFAMNYNMERLKLGILYNIQTGLISVEDTNKHANASAANAGVRK